MAQVLILLVVVLVIGSVGVGVTALIRGSDPGLVPSEPDGRSVPLPGRRTLTEQDVSESRFDLAVRGYRMAQVDRAMDRVAYDIGYKSELISVLEAEVEALREGRTADADALREARISAGGPPGPAPAGAEAGAAEAEPGTDSDQPYPEGDHGVAAAGDAGEAAADSGAVTAPSTTTAPGGEPDAAGTRGPFTDSTPPPADPSGQSGAADRVDAVEQAGQSGAADRVDAVEQAGQSGAADRVDAVEQAGPGESTGSRSAGEHGSATAQVPVDREVVAGSATGEAADRAEPSANGRARGAGAGGDEPDPHRPGERASSTAARPPTLGA